MNSVLSKFESVDAVVHCAGVFARGAFEDTPMLVRGKGREGKVC